MYKILIGVVLLLAVLGCNPVRQSAAVNSLSNNELRDGWQLLFDGTTTKGWHKYGGGSFDSAWKIMDGALCLDVARKKEFNVKGDWDIVTDEEYDNFHLKLEWKISEKGNSGIIFYIHENKVQYNWPWETGPEMQVMDNGTPTRPGHPDAEYYSHRAGDIYDILAAKEAVKPVGEWNLAEIVAVNGKLDLYLNGENILSTSLWDDNWQKMVANSKFKSMPGFGTYKKGRIGLQDHGDVVCYRNIRIRKL